MPTDPTARDRLRVRQAANPPCLECGRSTNWAPRRGLCQPCWRDPAIRSRYPRLRAWTRRVEAYVEDDDRESVADRLRREREED